MTLQTTFKHDGLVFSYITTGDLTDIARSLAKEPVCRYVYFGPNTDQETRDYFEPVIEATSAALDKNELPDAHVFTVRREDGSFVGQGALLPITFSPDNWEIALTVDDTCWRQGNGEKVCRFLVDYAFQTLNARRITGGHFEGNNGSGRIQEKCGFQSEGRQYKYWTKNGKEFDNILLGLTRERYEQE